MFPIGSRATCPTRVVKLYIYLCGKSMYFFLFLYYIAFCNISVHKTRVNLLKILQKKRKRSPLHRELQLCSSVTMRHNRIDESKSQAFSDKCRRSTAGSIIEIPEGLSLLFNWGARVSWKRRIRRLPSEPAQSDIDPIVMRCKRD